ncbi:SCF complex protein cullin 1, putative, partial [Rhizoctonia solani AG-3 Rhs1AP]
MSQLLYRVPGGLDPLRKRFGGDVQKAGLEAITDLQRAAASSPGGMVEPQAVVDTLSAVYRMNQDLVRRSFRSEALAAFVATLDQAFRNLVNQNNTIGALPTFPELLAMYADALLRKNSKLCEEDVLEDQLNKVLSRRLIYDLSGSNENEAFMISKLKETCGFEYTDKLQRMFIDIQLSKDLTNQFRERMEVAHDAADLGVPFSAMVLGANFWPLNAPTHSLIIPEDILPTHERFQRFYQNKHSGRKLLWLWKYSENELQTSYLNQRYMLVTSSYQTAVLLQYNENNSLHLDELDSATSIPKGLLTQVLAVLVRARILVNNEASQYSLNTNFRSKKIRVKLNHSIKKEVKGESADVLKTVNEGRKYVIQATVVRIMKARQTMRNQSLVTSAAPDFNPATLFGSHKGLLAVM